MTRQRKKRASNTDQQTTNRKARRVENEEDLYIRPEPEDVVASDHDSSSDSDRENTAPSNQASASTKTQAKSDNFWKYTVAIPGADDFKCKFCLKKLRSITRFK